MPALPPVIEAAFALEAPQDVLDALMPAYCEVLNADRCFIYVRDPATQTGSVVSSWSADPQWDDKHRPWAAEPDDLFTFDPLMGIASRTPVAVFIEDVETEGPDVVNIEFERRDYKHTAFIHAPVYDRGELVGILEPCTFGPARPWTPEDKDLTAAVQDRLGPLVGPWVRAEAQKVTLS
jgi:GAF domain-containing protein